MLDFTHSGRTITVNTQNTTYATASGAVLFWGSMAWYLQRSFRVNKSLPKLALFTAASYVAAGEWSKLVFVPVLQEAALLNNIKERGKHSVFILSRAQASPPGLSRTHSI